MNRASQPSFSGGELGPNLVARSDTEKYQSGLRRGRNVLLATAGGVFNRTGMIYCADTFSDLPSRLIPFQFSVDQGYAIELTDQRLRLVVNGGLVLTPELIVLDIEPNPLDHTLTVVTTQGPHGYVLGNDVYFQGIQGMTEINGKLARVLNATETQFTIILDTSGFGAFTGSTGGVAGDANGGTGGQAPPPPVPAPEAPPAPTPPFVNTEPDPPVVQGRWLGPNISEP